MRGVRRREWNPVYVKIKSMKCFVWRRNAMPLKEVIELCCLPMSLKYCLAKKEVCSL